MFTSCLQPAKKHKPQLPSKNKLLTTKIMTFCCESKTGLGLRYWR